MDHELTVGRIVSRTFSIWRINFPTLTLLTALILWPLLFIEPSGETRSDASTMRTILYLPVAFLLGSLVTGVLVFNVFQHLRNRHSGIGESLSTGISRLMPVLVVSLLSAIGIMVGMVLLVIPGIILMCAWYVAVPIVVIERPGLTASLSRSWDLTKGHRWTIFGIIVVLGLITGGSSLFVTFLTIGFPTIRLISGWIVSVFQSTLTAIAGCLIFYELKVFKEGTNIEELAAVFD